MEKCKNSPHSLHPFVIILTISPYSIYRHAKTYNIEESNISRKIKFATSLLLASATRCIEIENTLCESVSLFLSTFPSMSIITNDLCYQNKF